MNGPSLTDCGTQPPVFTHVLTPNETRSGVNDISRGVWSHEA